MITKRILAAVMALPWGDLITDVLCLGGLLVFEVGIYQVWGWWVAWLPVGALLIGLGCLRLRR